MRIQTIALPIMLLLYFAVFAETVSQNTLPVPVDTVKRAPQITDSSQQIADKIIRSKTPVLVDFWAVWCGPCRILNPIIAELEKEYKGKILFIKVNVDKHRAISQYFGISAIPSIFIIHNKAVVKAIPGLQEKSVYREYLNEVLATVTPEKIAPKSVPSEQKVK